MASAAPALGTSTLSADKARSRQSQRVTEWWIMVLLVLSAVFSVLTTLGILEIGGVFNIVVGLTVAWVGCVTMFAGEGREDHFVEAEFRRQLDAL